MLSIDASVRSTRSGSRHPSTLLIALLCALLLPLAAAESAAAQEAPTVDELLARHLEALGGEEAVAALKSLTIEGQYTAFSEPAEVTIHRAAPQLYSFDYRHQGRPYQAGYADARAWWATPLLGFDWAINAPGPEARVIYEEAFFLGPVAAAAQGYGGLDVVLGEAEDFDGEPAWELIVSFPDGSTSNWYLGRESYLAIGRSGPASDFGRPMSGRSFFFDYQPVAGVQIPHLVETEYGIRFRITEVASVTANPELAEGTFGFPAPRGMEDFAALEGEWEVQSRFRSSPRAPWAEEGTFSTFTTDLDGAVVVENITLPQGGSDLVTRRALSFDRQRGAYRYLVADATQPWHILLVGERAEDGSLVLDSTGTDTAPLAGERSQDRRITFRNISDNAFEVVTEVTPDGGENWLVVEELSYSRGE
ncbi:MAG: hypothetical protein AAGD01_15130 [Acidobacteriota bacterium]